MSVICVARHTYMWCIPSGNIFSTSLLVRPGGRELHRPCISQAVESVTLYFPPIFFFIFFFLSLHGTTIVLYQ